MITIDSIIDNVLSDPNLPSVEETKIADVEIKKKTETLEIPEYEKMARILEKMASEDTDTQDAVVVERDIDEVKTAMYKMAVGATIIDTLQTLDKKGTSLNCYKKYFQERRNEG